MSGMLLCRNQTVKQPYFISELGIHLYSGEELSYFIYHNTLLIDKDFLDERLFRFIGQELELKNLELKLRKWADQADLAELLLVILQDIHYYSNEELFRFRKEMERMAGKSQAQRLKDKADYLVGICKYTSALRQYDCLVSGDYKELSDETFCGKVWYNYGTAYARQFLWKEAGLCYEKAYKLLQQDNVLKYLYFITRMNQEIKLDKDSLKSITDEQARQWEKEWQDTRKQARFSGKGQEVAQWMDKDNIRRGNGLSELVANWKREYRRSQGS